MHLNYIVIVIGIVILITAVLLFKPKESFTSFKETSQLSNDIFKFIKENTTYSEYTDFMKNKDNLSYNIVKPQVFYELVTMKKLKLLTPQIIDSYIK